MNRRSILKAAVGACAALLFPWRKAKAGPSWARAVVFVPGPHKHPRRGDQTKRIEQLLESRYQDNPTPKFLLEIDVAAYEMGVIRHFEMPLTRVVLELGEHLAGVVDIDDSVAASMNDNDLVDRLLDAFLTSIHRKQTICITESNKKLDTRRIQDEPTIPPGCNRCGCGFIASWQASESRLATPLMSVAMACR